MHVMETNVIKEIYKGHYQVILDFPTSKDLVNIIDASYKYVWGISHIENSLEWKSYDYLLFGNKVNADATMVRNLEMEFLVDTHVFLRLIPNINQSVKIIQTNNIPPYYLNIKQLSGKSKYDLLKDKIDYLFEMELSGATDYAPLVSSDVAFLERVIKKMQVS